LLDQNNWLSESASEIFYDCTEKLEPENKSLDLEAGRKSLSRKDLGFFSQFVSTFLSFETLIASALNAQKKINKVDQLRILSREKNYVKFTVKSGRRTRHLRRIANNWIGFLTEFPKLFGLPAGRTNLRMLDDESFEIELRWKSGMIPVVGGILSPGPRGRLRWTALVGLISLRICMIKGALILGVPLLLSAIVLIYLELQTSKQKNLEHQNLEQLITRSEDRYTALLESTREVETLYRKSRVLSSVATKVVEAETAEEVILLATSRLHEELGFGRAMFFIKNEESGTLDLLAGKGIPSNLDPAARSLRFPIHEDTGNPDHIVNIFHSGKARVVRVTSGYLETLSPQARGFIEAAGIREFIALPVSTPSRNLGVLFVTAENGQTGFEEKNVETLSTVAQHLAMSIEKSKKMEEEIRLRTLFESYVSAEVIRDSGMGKGKNFARSGTAVILFCDLRGFTSLMRKQETAVDAGFELIQRFYETVNDAIYSRGGIVNKFLGDGALAVFEVKNPADAPIIAQAAIDAAIQIQSRSLVSSEGNLQVCAGVHLGQVVFATVGKTPKLEFTVLGDAVNLSSRLCNLSKDLDNQVVISSRIKQVISPHRPVRSLGNFRIKGIESEMDLYSIEKTEQAA
jgi:adenylate cyclase